MRIHPRLAVDAVPCNVTVVTSDENVSMRQNKDFSYLSVIRPSLPHDQIAFTLNSKEKMIHVRKIFGILESLMPGRNRINDMMECWDPENRVLSRPVGVPAPDYLVVTLEVDDWSSSFTVILQCRPYMDIVKPMAVAMCNDERTRTHIPNRMFMIFQEQNSRPSGMVGINTFLLNTACGKRLIHIKNYGAKLLERVIYEVDISTSVASISERSSGPSLEIWSENETDGSAVVREC
ncbi:hypothetical protein B0J11DRAFT_508754 [Dendryphion nanum]|uniref:Uncharacterized protein n=1 Tax=Dendryphion nanum TaxID=256645 RepID=A0A9P9IGP1_9PLEO|nr:hypothetical protein B0J11DRAFT_508754 [Dendryphion nanum]